MGQSESNALRRSGLSSERGQSIVIFILGFLILVGFTALVIDGGFFYWQRQMAQNAADAAALAGAGVLCGPESTWLVDGSLQDEVRMRAAGYLSSYSASLENMAVSREAGTDLLYDTVEIQAQVTFTPFFAPAIGISSLTATASARAACTPAVAAEGPLPVSWACQGAPGGDNNCPIAFHDADGCQFGDSDDLYLIFVNPHEQDPKASCSGDGGTGLSLECPDNIFVVENDLTGAWLDLDPGSTSPKDWIAPPFYRFPGSLTIDKWYRAALQPGSDYIDRLITYYSKAIIPLPIYDNVNSSSGDMPQQIFSPQDGSTSKSYHVASVAAFQIACVHDRDLTDDGCLGSDWLVGELSRLHWEGDKFDTVEGCFTRAVFQGPHGSQEVDSGAYNIALVK